MVTAPTIKPKIMVYLVKEATQTAVDRCSQMLGVFHLRVKKKATTHYIRRKYERKVVLE